jgi:diguanylate cyclase (GGDEF)-like protein
MLRPGGRIRHETKRSRQRVGSWCASWEIRKLPLPAAAYIVVLSAVWLAVVVVAILSTPARLEHVLTFGLLVAGGCLAIEATRSQGELAGVVSNDLLAAWWLPIAFVLPPVYSLLAPIPLMVLTQYRIRPAAPYRRAFSVASIGLANWLAATAFHVVSNRASLDLTPGTGVLAWAGVAVACAVLASAVNAVLLAVAAGTSSPEETITGVLRGAVDVVPDWGEVCIGVILAVLCMLNPLLALLALTPVVLLQRGLLHDQLTAAARLDAKTDLLNAPAWEREATSEIARAVRTRSSLSVMLLDLDHFKQVNDYFGHLIGDDVIRAVAGVLQQQTREYDRCGRFGGDEFAVLLPQSDGLEAHRTAERIRRHVAALAVPAGERFVAASVSIGVAELTGPDQDVTDLLAAADVELYKAKELRPPAPTGAWQLEKY